MKRLIHKIKENNERGARETFLEELFYDLNRSRVQVYKMNFVRGIFFGFGSVLGGTVVIALFIWMLSFFTDIPGVGDPIQQIKQSLQREK